MYNSKNKSINSYKKKKIIKSSTTNQSELEDNSIESKNKNHSDLKKNSYDISSNISTDLESDFNRNISLFSGDLSQKDIDSYNFILSSNNIVAVSTKKDLSSCNEELVSEMDALDE